MSASSIDTIYALASGQGVAGVAVVRVSGPLAHHSFDQFSSYVCDVRKAVVRKLYDPDNNSLIDEAMIIRFDAPQSYTGEHVVEYHLHGGKAVRDSFMSALSKMKGHRLAEAGEFTRRAFENGQMDLTQAEAVADLIHAETELQKQLALHQMGGALHDLYQGWAGQLIKALAYAEAQIDFSEEELPEEEVQAQIHPVLTSVLEEIADHLNDNNRGERIRDGIKIAIIGAPNAGKSSLINALAKRDVAIVSDMAGTTRDILSVQMDIDGYPVTLYDTAGLRPEQLDNSNAQDRVEAEGIKRAMDLANQADLKILLFDATSGNPHIPTIDLKDEKSIMVCNKCDEAPVYEGMLAISAQSSEGLGELLNIVSRETQTLFNQALEIPSLTRNRHREAVLNTQDFLKKALVGQSPDMIAEDIRMAVRSLGKITGRTDVEDLLDIIFRDFCIGK